MSSASRGSGTRRRMKLRSRNCSRLTTLEIRWSCSSGIRFRLSAFFIYSCRRMRGCGYCRVAKLLRAIARVNAAARNKEKRTTMSFDLPETLDILGRTPTVVGSLLRGTSAPWHHTNEGPDTWSAFDVVGHLIHGEETDWVA